MLPADKWKPDMRVSPGARVMGLYIPDLSEAVCSMGLPGPALLGPAPEVRQDT